MGTKQINLKLPKNLIDAARRYVRSHGYRNIQELASESIREKIFEESEYDEIINQREIELIDDLIELSIKKGEVVSEEELNNVLNGV